MSFFRDLTDEEGPKEISLGKRFFNLQTLVSFAIALAILIFFFTRLDVNMASLWANIKTASPLFYLLGFFFFYLSFPLRGFRWHLLLGNVGFRRGNGVRIPSIWGLTEIVLVSWFANCVVPAKLGDAYRAFLLKVESKVSFSKTAGTILAERVVDMVVLFALLAVAAVGIVRSQNATVGMNILVAGFLLVVVIVAFLLFMRQMRYRFQTLLPRRLRGIWDRFQEGTWNSFRQMPLVIALTLAVWLCETARLFFVVTSLNLSFPLSFILFVALANSLLTVLPLTPGGLGLVEAGVTGLFMIVTGREQALAITILDRTISYWSLILIGLLFFFIRLARTGRPTRADAVPVSPP